MKLRTFTLCVLALAAGCQRESGADKAQKAAHRHAAPVTAQRGPTVQELTAGMVEAATQGKSQTPVGLKFDVLGKPMQGEPVDIAIALLPGEAAGPATVELSGSPGLPVPADQAKFEFPAVEPAQVYRHSVRLTPNAEGVMLLTLTVNLQHDQLSDTRIFSLPLIVAAGPSAASASASPPPAPPASPST